MRFSVLPTGLTIITGVRPDLTARSSPRRETDFFLSLNDLTPPTLKFRMSCYYGCPTPRGSDRFRTNCQF